MKVNVMVDIETLGTGESPVITQIAGVCDYGKTQIFVGIQSCLEAGMKIDGETIRWWMSQSDSARSRFQIKGKSIESALIDFADWIETMKVEAGKAAMIDPESVEIILWGNGAAFDNVILSNAYGLLGIDKPWSYKNDRCYRTLKAVVKCEDRPPDVGVAHDALADAEYQFAHLKMLLSKLNRGD